MYSCIYLNLSCVYMYMNVGTSLCAPLCIVLLIMYMYLPLPCRVAWSGHSHNLLLQACLPASSSNSSKEGLSYPPQTQTSTPGRVSHGRYIHVLDVCLLLRLVFVYRYIFLAWLCPRTGQYQHSWSKALTWLPCTHVLSTKTRPSWAEVWNGTSTPPWGAASRWGEGS